MRKGCLCALPAWLARVSLVCAAGLAAPVQADAEKAAPGLTTGYELLFMGNSHSSSNGLPALVATMITQAPAPGTAHWQLAPGFRFLDERLVDGVSLPLLTSRGWTHVILQAQKYSTSGQYYYPTNAAEEFIRIAKAQGTRPILFPEWPRRGNDEEGLRVHQLHLDIASREAACVAPIGLAWEASLASRPDLRLHDSDGNHSNLNGAVLTAYVLYEVITGQKAAELPDISALGISAANQQHFRTIASSVVASDSSTCQPLAAPPANIVVAASIPALGPLGLAVLIVLTAGVAWLTQARMN